MRDGAVRRAVKWLGRVAAGLDLRVARALGPKPRYRLTGVCNGCGRCCEAPTLQVGRLTWRWPALRAAALWWQRVVNGFEFVSQDARFRTFTFRCSHYEPQTKRCDSYESRPLSCRDYPVNVTHEANPVLFDECSHRVVDVKAGALRAALLAAKLPPEKLAELEEKLHLRDEDPP